MEDPVTLITVDYIAITPVAIVRYLYMYVYMYISRIYICIYMYKDIPVGSQFLVLIVNYAYWQRPGTQLFTLAFEISTQMKPQVHLKGSGTIGKGTMCGGGATPGTLTPMWFVYDINVCVYIYLI